MSVKGYLAQVSRSYRRYQRKVGTTVTWWELDTARTHALDIYDEATTVEFKPGFELPIMSVVRDEDRETAREEGLYTGGTVHLTFSAEQAAQAGMTDPHNSRLHLRDRFYWDGEYWAVNAFQISGRLIRQEVVIGVDSTRIATEELVNYPDFPPTPGH
jgi:hypothetical protein